MDKFIETLIDHEGKRKSAYKDSLGWWSIGIGRLIDARKKAGLSQEEMIYLLKNDIETARKPLEKLEWFNKLDKVRQEVFIELCFNMGYDNLMKFKRTIGAVKEGKYEVAAEYLLESLWARQVKSRRANNVAKRLRTGRYD